MRGMTTQISRQGRLAAVLVAGVSVFALSGCGAKAALDSGIAQSLKSAAASAIGGTQAGACAEVLVLAPQAAQLATQLASGQITSAQAQQQLPALEQKLAAADGNGSTPVGQAITKMINDAKALQSINPTDTAARQQAESTLKTDAAAIGRACVPGSSAS